LTQLGHSACSWVQPEAQLLRLPVIVSIRPHPDQQ